MIKTALEYTAYGILIVLALIIIYAAAATILMFLYNLTVPVVIDLFSADFIPEQITLTQTIAVWVFAGVVGTIFRSVFGRKE